MSPLDWVQSILLVVLIVGGVIHLRGDHAQVSDLVRAHLEYHRSPQTAPFKEFTQGAKGFVRRLRGVS